MQFGPWYPLADARDLAPVGAGMLQLRIETGLVDYPRGKSAMVWYEHAADVRAAAVGLAARFAGQRLLCRHLIEIDGATDLAAFCAKLRTEFVRRFGAVPQYEPRRS